MGVKRTTGKEMGFDDVEGPMNNLKAGTKYYKMLLKKFKDGNWPSQPITLVRVK